MSRRLPPGFFFKGHGLGNDYIVLETRSLGVRLTPRSIRLICDRHLGIGSDGIALHEEVESGPPRSRASGTP